MGGWSQVKGAAMNMIEVLRDRVRMEVRPGSFGSEYLEAVVTGDDIDLLTALLTDHAGPAAKEPGKGGVLPVEVQGLVDSLGGLRKEQSFYYHKTADNTVVYAALWPWQSDPGKITLKAGVVSL
jgi:hypothetical protein